VTICVVPLTPDGATLDSFAAAIHHLNVFSSSRYTLGLLSGKQTDLAKDVFGQAAITCTQTILSGPFSSKDSILDNHTLWPLYAYTLPLSLREEWREAQLSTATCPWRAFLYGRHPSQLIKTAKSACINCVQEDLDQYGIAYWRTHHQIPGIAHCIRHFTPLVAACAACGTSIRPKFTSLPSLYCWRCGAELSGPNPQQLPAPYWKMLEIMRFLFDGNWKILSPEIRRPYYKKALLNLKLPSMNKETVQRVVARINKRWHVTSLESLSELLGFSIDAESIASALGGTDVGCTPLLHVLLLEQFYSTQRKVPDLFSISQLECAATQYVPPVAIGPYALPIDKQNALLSALDRTGLSRSILYDLASGLSWKHIGRLCHFVPRRTQRLDALVPWLPPYRRVIAADKWATSNSNIPGDHADFSRRLRGYRRIALECVAEGCSGWRNFYRDHRSAYQSLKRNDQAFFDEIRAKLRIPNGRGSRDLNHSVERCKLRVLQAINSPSAPTRTQIWRLEKRAMLTLTKNCRGWLQSKLPPALSSAAACQHYRRHQAR
jgi:hypothetical protein